MARRNKGNCRLTWKYLIVSGKLREMTTSYNTRFPQLEDDACGEDAEGIPVG